MKGTIQVSSLKGITVKDLTISEIEELKSIAFQFGDVTLIADNTNLHTLYNIAKASKQYSSVARKISSQKLERFVLSAAASRRLYYTQHRESTERKQSLAGRMMGTEDPIKKRRKRSGEETQIFK